MLLIYQLLLLAQVVLLSMVSQRVIGVVAQSPMQVMISSISPHNQIIYAITIHITCIGD
jgi:hypothetical protein